ncbi:MAG TPA: carboxylesterase/lipase family protein [Dehalococcoidales bacterium]
MTGPIVETKAGKIEGTLEKGLYVFKGIPFAAPPTGELRWASPQPVKPWPAVRPANSFGPAAVQPPSKARSIAEFAVELPQSEDCLYLNVWSPGLYGTDRPVMVWIHGGLFTMGSGGQPTFSGDILANAGNVVVVTINYRLGAFGFLNLEQLTGGKITATGNEGLLDQVAALKWVKDNIAAFGGDPQNITAFGESAGAASIECLLVMPEGYGLIQKAILQSSLGKSVRTLEQASSAAKKLLEERGIKKVDQQALRELPALTILEAQKSATNSGRSRGYGPVVDGKILTNFPPDAIQGGAAAGIPILAGTNLEEARLFGALDGRTTMDEKKAMSTAEQTDTNFRLPNLRLLEARCRNREKAYRYLFNWKSPTRGGIFGACHGLEIGFVFGHFDANFCGVGPAADRLSGQMQDAWTTFARTGDPSCESLGNWPPYCEKQITMTLGKDSGFEQEGL